MKKFLLLLAVGALLWGCTGDAVWNKDISGNRITIRKQSDYLELHVFVPKPNVDKYCNQEGYEELLTEALADYLKLTDKGKFQCPGMEAVSEKDDKNGVTACFRIPAATLKVLQK